MMNWDLTRAVWRRNWIQFKRGWLVSFFWTVIEPTFILAGLGFGVGSYIPSMDGVSYADFFLPALICNSAMMVAFFVSTYDGFSKLGYQNLFRFQITTPLSALDIANGEVLWAATKGMISAVGVLLVASVFGLARAPEFILILPIVFLLALVSAAFGFVVTTMVRNYEQIIYPTSGVIVPMSLFCGTYFPLGHLPSFVQWILWISPLTHAVRLSRDLVQGHYDWTLAINAIYLLAAFVIFQKIAVHRLEKKLII